MIIKTKYEIVEHTKIDNYGDEVFTYSLRKNWGLFHSYVSDDYGDENAITLSMLLWSCSTVCIVASILILGFKYLLCYIPVFYLHKYIWYVFRKTFSRLDYAESKRDLLIKKSLSRNKTKNKVINTTIIDKNTIKIEKL